MSKPFKETFKTNLSNFKDSWYIPHYKIYENVRKYPALCISSDENYVLVFKNRKIKKYILDFIKNKITGVAHTLGYIFIVQHQNIDVIDSINFKKLFSIIYPQEIKKIKADEKYLYINTRKYSLNFSWILEIDQGEETKDYHLDRYQDENFKFELDFDHNIINLYNITEITPSNISLIITKKPKKPQEISLIYPEIDLDIKAPYIIRENDTYETLRESLKTYT